MLKAPMHAISLARAGLALARAGLPKVLGTREALPAPARWLSDRLAPPGDPDPETLSRALTDLGPSYIKLGQFLATRPDIIGARAAAGLSVLQDRLEPFPEAAARAEIARAFGMQTEELFESFGAPVAAASIAQVHEATVADGPLAGRVAVKVLRPAIEQCFSAELESFYFAARTLERIDPNARRLRPVEVVATLERSVELEMDMRLEAAAISEMAENIGDDSEFRVPGIDWTRTARRVLTTEWIDGVSLHDTARLEAEGHDLKRLGRIVIQSFLRQALDHGFFHADLHPGNLFADAEGRLVAVDFGIMGRLGAKERRFLAEILWGLIKRDYTRTAEVHLEAGYVPPRHSTAAFAQALRAIGEPLAGRNAEEISMARVLTQLFEVTEQFDMATRPELLLLQKTMVVAEGVARTLDPQLDMWSTAEPIVGDWMERRLSPEGRIEDAAEGAASLGRLVAGLPEFLDQAEHTAMALASLAREAAERGELRKPADREEDGRGPLFWMVAGGAIALVLAQFL